MLIFGKANAKLVQLEKLTGKKVFTISTLAGVGCPYADKCNSRAVETPAGMRILDGPNTEFRCFSASQEVLFPTVYRARKHNRELILACQNKLPALVNLLQSSIPKKAGIVRLHVSGDFFTQNHYDAWMEVARRMPHVVFYGYTKCLPFYVKRYEFHPDNFRMTPSMGGKRDDLIHRFNLHYARVVKDQNEADALGLPVDHTDEHAILPEFYGKPFALALHGVNKGHNNQKGYGYSRKKVGVS